MLNRLRGFLLAGLIVGGLLVGTTSAQAQYNPWGYRPRIAYSATHYSTLNYIRAANAINAYQTLSYLNAAAQVNYLRSLYAPYYGYPAYAYPAYTPYYGYGLYPSTITYNPYLYGY